MKKNILLFFASLSAAFLVIELGYRVFDPYPYHFSWEVNYTEHGSTLEYNPYLGWVGKSDAEQTIVLPFAKWTVKNNHYGYRDINHGDQTGKPAIVFLGDSFTEGFGVEQEDMFTSILRNQLPDYEIFNLASRGYGADQSLIAFKSMPYQASARHVVLMFSKNDFRNNAHVYQYGKLKPLLTLKQGQLFLINTPVPVVKPWFLKNETKPLGRETYSFKQQLMEYLQQSHFIHDMMARMERIVRPSREKDVAKEESRKENWYDYKIAEKIFESFKRDTEKKGGVFTVVVIPTKKELDDAEPAPYRSRIQTICKNLNINYVDLAPHFKKSFFRTYFRDDPHWNKRGHRLTADVLYQYLKKGDRLLF